METWTCSRCRQTHTGIPGFSFDAPWPWYTTPKGERDRNCQLAADYCILFNEDFFIRGCIEIHVHGESEPFVWGVWVSLSKANFEQERALAQDPRRIEHPPYFGWLCSRIQIYPDTLLLKTLVHTRRVGVRPYIELEPTDHPLAVDQRMGITAARAHEIREWIQHKWLHPEWDKKGLYSGAL